MFGQFPRSYMQKTTTVEIIVRYNIDDKANMSFSQGTSSPYFEFKVHYLTKYFRYVRLSSTGSLNDGRLCISVFQVDITLTLLEWMKLWDVCIKKLISNLLRNSSCTIFSSQYYCFTANKC